MQYFLLSIIALPFLWINYKIVKTDLKEKKIPNKLLGYLLLLLPFWWIFLSLRPVSLIEIGILPETGLNLLFFCFSIILTFLISFILYYFGIWSAGDAKYLLILALFIPHIGIIPFIGNIALLTIIYLILYFLRFYFGKCLFNWIYTRSLYSNIYNDLKDKWLVKKKNTNTHTIFIILKWLIVFLIVFISIRLTRIYIFTGIFGGNPGEGINRFEFLKDILEKYHIYIFILLLGLFIGFLWGIKGLITKIKTYIINKFKKKIFDKYKINSEIIDNIFLAILFVILLSFIIFEYIKNPYEIETYLIRIFTIYLAIWGMFKILIYMYKITFSIAETYYVDIKDLKEGDIIDKEYLVKMFGEQKSLGFVKNINEDDEKGLLYPNPAEYFRNIENPIDDETKEKLNKIFEIVNNYHKKEKTLNFKEINSIKILRTFSFGGYIFIGFMISFIIGNKIFLYLINLIIEYFKSFYN